MNFVVSEDQLALAGAIRALCAGRFALDRLRAREGGSRVVDAADWEELGRAGVFSIRLSEAHGGLGLGMAESVVVFEELGRGLVPGPLVASALAAGLVDGASDGSVMVGSVTRPPAGMPALVAHLDVLGKLVVVDDEGLALVDASSLDARPVERSLDPLTPMWIVNGDLPTGERIGGPEGAVGWRYGEALLTSALCVGLGAVSLEMAVEYARVASSSAAPLVHFRRSSTFARTCSFEWSSRASPCMPPRSIADDPEVGDPIRAMAGATLLAVEAALENGRKNIQVHGGMGFTWDVPAHLYLMRARVLEHACVAGDELAETVSRNL